MASPFPPSVQTAAAALGIDVSQIGQQEVSLLTQILAASSAIASGGGGGSGITQLTGDVTAGPGSGSVVATLATVNSNVGSFTNANITVDAKGRITAAANGSGVTIPGSATQVLTSDGAGGVTATGVMIDGSNNVTGVAELDGTLIWAKGADGTYPEVRIGSLTKYGYLTCDAGDFYIATGSIPLIIQGQQTIIRSDLGLFSEKGITSQITDAATNTVVTALTLSHATSATAAAGLGVAEVFQLPSAAGTNRTAGQISTAWTSAVDGAESSVVTIQPMLGGALASGLSVGPITLAYSGGSVTGSATLPFASITGTWNTSGAPNALLVNITDTASTAGSVFAATGTNLLNLQIGGTSQAWITKEGFMHLVGGSASNTFPLVIGASGANGFRFFIPDSGGGNAGKYTFEDGDGNILFVGSRPDTNIGLSAAKLSLGSDPYNPTAILVSSGTSLIQSRNTANSAFGQIQGKLTTDANAVTGLVAGALAALTTASITITDASGQVYRVPCLV